MRPTRQAGRVAYVGQVRRVACESKCESKTRRAICETASWLSAGRSGQIAGVPLAHRSNGESTLPTTRGPWAR